MANMDLLGVCSCVVVVVVVPCHVPYGSTSAEMSCSVTTTRTSGLNVTQL